MIALLLLNVSPDYHNFSVLDLEISFDYRAQPKVGLPLLVIFSVVVPFLIITFLFLFSFGLVAGPGRGHVFSVQLRNLNAGLFGLGVSLATVTVALKIKNLAGKPRLDFFERCQLDVGNIAAYAVWGSNGRSVSKRWVMVTREICQADWCEVNEGFRSFPSGYATSECSYANIIVLSASFNSARVVAFAGLWYFTLFTSAKFRIVKYHTVLLSSRLAGSDNHRLSSNTEDAGVLDTFLPPASWQIPWSLRSFGYAADISSHPAVLVIRSCYFHCRDEVLRLS